MLSDENYTTDYKLKKRKLYFCHREFFLLTNSNKKSNVS